MCIPAHHMEIEQVYARILASGCRSVSISSANPGDGVTSIASALAQRSLLAGNSTLLVDLNLYHPTLKPAFGLDDAQPSLSPLEQPQLVTVQEQSIALTGITAPTRREIIIKLRKPGVLEQCIQEWQRNFDTVIFDTSPICRVNANNIPPERVAAACDGALLVVLAGYTTEAMVSAAMAKLSIAGARMLGGIFNDKHNPNLKNELLREIKRLEPRYCGISRRLSNWIRRSRFLSLEI